jgi:3-hydroxyisobutyrate dehydrogenase-like beta-hydroxyacid dehydrogenase
VRVSQLTNVCIKATIKSKETQVAKLAVNLMIAVSAGVMADTLALARKGGNAWRIFLEFWTTVPWHRRW